MTKKTAIQKAQDQQIKIDKILDASADNLELSTKELRKLTSQSGFGLYFIIQEHILKDLLEYEKIAKKAIEDEIAAGGTGDKAEISFTTRTGKTGTRKARGFLESSSMYTKDIERIDDGLDEKGNPEKRYRTLSTAAYSTHLEFIQKFTNTEGWQLGHQGIANATMAAELYLSKLSPDDPRRPKVKAIVAGMRRLDKADGRFLSRKLDGTLDTEAELHKAFAELEGLENVDSVADYTRSVDVLKNRGHLEFDVMFEVGKANKDKGNISRAFMAELMKVIRTGGGDIVDAYDLLHIPGSKTFMRALKDQMIDAALGKTIRPDTAKKKARGTAKLDMGAKKLSKKQKEISAKKKTALRRLHAMKASSGGTHKSRAQGTGQGDSLAPLMAILNQKLPQTVVKNMGPPGLQNRTGRFASSVKVTDVSRTAQGFPSVGYTYQKNPYQVFEMGQGQPPWADPDRDPRKLIDASIREIAAQFAIGRFYTRRI